MRGSTGEVSLPQPELRAASRVARYVVSATVVLGAGAGYVGSRIWPLSALSGPTVNLASTDTASFAESASIETAPHLTSRVSLSAAASDASEPLPLSSQSPAAAVANVPEEARIEVRGTSTSSPDPSVAPRTETPQRKAANARAARTVRAQTSASSSVVEFAPNPRPNQALRDYMSYPSRN
jgi:hypothetical protein